MGVCMFPDCKLNIWFIVSCCVGCSVSHPENVLANATWTPYFETEANIGPEVIHLYEVHSINVCVV